MKVIQKTAKNTFISFLKKQDDISKYGPYVEMCYNAMTHLKRYKGFEVSDDKLYERNYIISLSYMMGKYDGKEEKMSGLIVGGDINKYVFDECIKTATEKIEKIKKTKEVLGFSTNYVAPDFVIHKNNRIKDVNERNQKIIIESKTKNNLLSEEFFDDFFKLNVYLSRLKFRYGIYLLINTSFNRVNDFVRGYLENDYFISEKCKNRLLFLIQESESVNPALYVFKEDPKTYQLKCHGQIVR